MSEGRQSPSPQRQTGAQVNDPPGSGVHSKNKTSEQVQDASKSQLGNLSSNPRGPMEDSLESKFSKGTGNNTS
ncbi:hypothetical protein ACQRIT_006110 [Beauveria bassiana]|uniref:Uncharacterized protein n=1 Tax=Beauveria bassiana (strain ARSEF 2860) TaxID=655819 RepID=J4W9E7_BEAB2|nr:uncharacterized protein BBA_04088 [Beauveria bassiana ARSEF 2860]EJP66795.1 hypothetical protein BBA_04088 [Beauveria bassiana ARSEF 2860]